MKTILKTFLLLALTGTAFAQSVPPPRVDGQVARPGVPNSTGTNDARVPSAVKALDIVTDVKKGTGYVGTITDSVTGEHYKGAVKGYGTFVDRADLAVDMARGYYREGWAGVGKEAVSAIEDEARDQAIKAGASALVEYYGVSTVAVPAAAATAAVAASAGFGIFVGKQIDDHFRQDIGRGTNWVFNHCDRHVLEPRREAQAERMRERFLETKVQNAAAAAASAASPLAESQLLAVSREY